MMEVFLYLYSRFKIQDEERGERYDSLILHGFQIVGADSLWRTDGAKVDGWRGISEWYDIDIRKAAESSRPKHLDDELKKSRDLHLSH